MILHTTTITTTTAAVATTTTEEGECWVHATCFHTQISEINSSSYSIFAYIALKDLQILVQNCFNIILTGGLMWQYLNYITFHKTY
jgi:hypothetical protein